MHFNGNFSSALETKLEDFLSTSDENILASQIEVSFYTPGTRFCNHFINTGVYEIIFFEWPVAVEI